MDKDNGRVPAGQALVNGAASVSTLTGFDPSRWNFDMEAAPKDRPILAWCRGDCVDPQCGYFTGEGTTLCLYHGHAEGMSSVGDGPAIIEWGGSWDDSTWEYPNGGWMPDWWFRYGSEFEEAANPVAWMPIEAPKGIAQ